MIQYDFNVQSILEELRQSLPGDSATAMAIDGNAPRLAIARLARRDGFVDFAERIESALLFCPVPPQDQPRAAA